MKKYAIILMLTFVCQTSFAQSVESIYDDFKNEKGVESVNVSPMLMKFARLFMSKEDKDNPIMKGINSIRVLNLEESPKEVQERFIKEMGDLDLNGYETWIQAKDDGDNVKIMAKTKDDIVKELLVLTTGKDNCALVMMKGNIKQEDMQAIVSENQIMIDGRK